MRRDRPGCFSPIGLTAALVTALVIAGYGFARGGLLYNPGPLNAQSGAMLGGVTSHAEIGGDCKACHTAPWESETMADRCVVCHSNIAVELRDVESLHGAIMQSNPELSCRHCHAEHGGADAALTVMDGAVFPHEVVGFSLKGHQFTAANETFACDDCHQGDITTFAQDRCQACHQQIAVSFMQSHLLAFGADCLACHDGVDRFGGDFDHARFDFKLTGKHAQVMCTQCHLGARSIADFQSAPRDCLSCHRMDEPHQGRFGTDCAACHSTEGWTPASFDHNLTSFPLTGGHAGLSCQQCHSPAQFAGLSTSCASCHAEPVFHASLFGLDCATCHTTQNWFALFSGPHPEVADEGGTGVNHGGATCRDCHTQTLHTATCLKCHDSNDPDDNSGSGSDNSGSGGGNSGPGGGND